MSGAIPPLLLLQLHGADRSIFNCYFQMPVTGKGKRKVFPIINNLANYKPDKK